MPDGRHALADQIAPDKRDRFLADIRALVDQGVARLPDHGHFLADRRRAARPTGVSS